MTLFYAPADKVTPGEFLETIFPGIHEASKASVRRSIETCVYLIDSGQSTYGYGPYYVEEAQKLIAERGQPYSELKRTGTGGWL